MVAAKVAATAAAVVVLLLVSLLQSLQQVFAAAKIGAVAFSHTGRPGHRPAGSPAHQFTSSLAHKESSLSVCTFVGKLRGSCHKSAFAK